MKEDLNIPNQTLEFFLDLEKQIWEAFRTGDMQKDAEHLSEDFLGEYPDGNLDKAGHVNQLKNDPLAESYEIFDPQLEIISATEVTLSYRAEWIRPSEQKQNEQSLNMKVSSIWKHIEGRWLNTYSTDEWLVT